MASPSRAKITIEVSKHTPTKYGWEILRGAAVVARSRERYSRSDAARRSLRHIIKSVATELGGTVTFKSSTR